VQSTLTAEALSDCFGLALQVEHRDGRWSARAARPDGPGAQG
jgi:hypothetical protein